MPRNVPDCIDLHFDFKKVPREHAPDPLGYAYTCCAAHLEPFAFYSLPLIVTLKSLLIVARQVLCDCLDFRFKHLTI